VDEQVLGTRASGQTRLQGNPRRPEGAKETDGTQGVNNNKTFFWRERELRVFHNGRYLN